MNNIKSLNSRCPLRTSVPSIGMIDASAYISSLTTWPVPVSYVLIENTKRGVASVQYIDIETAMERLSFIDGVKCRHFTTAGMGNLLVKLNTRMYNRDKTHSPEDLENLFQMWEDINKLLSGRTRKDLKNKKELSRLDELEEEEKSLRMALTDVDRKDIPSLIIVHTNDMEFAHLGGYDGELIYQEDKETGQVFYKKHGQGLVCLDEDDALMFQTWERQISDVEAVVAKNPSRILPIHAYDPRRYGLSNDGSPGGKGCEAWNKPFARIVGHKDTDANVKKIWLGFYMNPALGFRPFDEYCEHLPRFYKECVENNIPILAHCAPGGITAHDAEYYPDNLDERINKSKERHDMMQKEELSSYRGDALCSSMYYGSEQVIDAKYDGLDSFYMHYGHPRNWIPVLEHCPDLCLCLIGFGGNREWQRANWPDNGATLPTSHWLRCIIKLTAIYKNVYADLSGLNIYDEKIRNGLLRMLELAQDEESDEFKHLKHKLIFGSGGYLTYLTEASRGGKGIDGGDAVRHSYSNYCNEFKKLFYVTDKEGKGKLWEYVSAINPWKFYALSEEKFNKMHEELSKNAEGQNSGTYELSQELRDYCAYMSGGNNDGTNWEPWKPMCDDPDLGSYEPKEKLFHVDDSPFDELRSMIEAFANSHKGIVDVKSQSVIVSDTLRDSLIQNLIDMIERALSEAAKKANKTEQDRSISATPKRDGVCAGERKILSADWLKEVQQILKNGAMNLIIELVYNQEKEFAGYIERRDNDVYIICLNAYIMNMWMNIYYKKIPKNAILRLHCVHEFKYVWQMVTKETEKGITMLAINTDSTSRQDVIDDALLRLKQTYEAANESAQTTVLGIMKMTLPGVIGLVFWSKEVAELWKQYLDGGVITPIDLSNKETIVKAFKENGKTKKAMKIIYRETQKYFKDNPDSLPKLGEVPIKFELTSIIGSHLRVFSMSGHKESLNFNCPFTIPGNIAGDFGGFGDQTSAKYGNHPSEQDDTRRVDGNVFVSRGNINGKTRIIYEFEVNFKIIDTIDFVPGGLGRGIEWFFTYPLAWLERAGKVGDVPFTISYCVGGRAIGGERLQLSECKCGGRNGGCVNE